MAWVKIDDAFFRHPKVATAGRDARDLYLAALCYAGAQLTDGFVPGGVLRQLGADADIDNPDCAASRLVATGLWHEADGGWTIHDYHDYQPSAEQVKAQRAATAERVSRWRAARRPLQVGYADTGNARSNAVTNAPVTPAPVPIPVPRDSPPLNPPTGGAAMPLASPGVSLGRSTKRPRLPRTVPKHDAAGFEATWEHYGLKVGRAAAVTAWDRAGPPPDQQAEWRVRIDEQRLAYGWDEPDGQAQPHLSTWINQARHLDRPKPRRGALNGHIRNDAAAARQLEIRRLAEDAERAAKAERLKRLKAEREQLIAAGQL